MTWALLGTVVVLVGANITQSIWLHSANSQRDILHDFLDSERKLSAQYHSERDISVAKETVTAKSLEQETALRKSTESRLADAEQQLRTYLAQVLGNAPQKDIDAAIANVFRAPAPRVVPAPSKAAPAKAGPDDLGDPAD